MSKLYRVFVPVFFVFAGMACSSDFLDRDPHNNLSDEKATSNYAKLKLATNGLYANFMGSAVYGEFMFLGPEVMADNVVRSAVRSSGRYMQEFNLTLGASDPAPDELYNYLYYIANAACNVIHTLESGAYDRQGASDADVNQILGEALFVRGWCHFDACRIFAHAYTITDVQLAPGADGAGGHLGVPVITDSRIQEVPRSSVKAVYDSVIHDLSRAASLMTVRKNCTWASSEVAKAMLARVYLYKGDYAAAARMATEVIGSNRYTLTPAGDFVRYWALGAQPETIFEIQINKSDDDFDGGSNNPGGVYLYYGDLVASKNLVSLYESRDVRLQLVELNGDGEYTVKKFPGREDAGTYEINNAIVLRLSEMYLIRAEANYKGKTNIGDTPLNDINEIRTHRGVAALDAVTNETIEQERRRELAFEGHRFFDVGRNKQNLVRTECTATPSVTYPDKRFVFPIPLYEMNNNSNMEQNPGY